MHKHFVSSLFGGAFVVQKCACICVRLLWEKVCGKECLRNLLFAKAERRWCLLLDNWFGVLCPLAVVRLCV